MAQDHHKAHKHVPNAKPADGWGDWPSSSKPGRKTTPLSIPLPTAPRRGSRPNRSRQRPDEEREHQREERGRQREQEHAQRLRQDALRREESHLQQQLWRLDAEEAALSMQWAALPSPPSLLVGILIALVVLSGIAVLLLFYPILLLPLIVVLLLMAKARRYRMPGQHTAWAGQERERLQHRWSGIIAERTVITQQLASIQQELSQLHLP